MLLSIRLGSIANLLFILLIVYAAAQAQDKQVAAPRDPVLVTISEKTTRITTPLKESGYPDFLEAVNLQAKGKVTPEKNGAILVLKAVGLKEKYPELTPAQKEEFYIRLGIDPQPVDAPTLVFSDEYVDALSEEELPEPNQKERKLKFHEERVSEIRTRVHHEFGACSERPWKSADHPRVVRWLTLQQPVLAHLDRLADFPLAYLPTIAGKRDRSLLAAEHPLHDSIRKLIYELNMRAMNSLGEDRIDAAIDDLERMLLLRTYLRSNPHGIITNLAVISLGSTTHPLFNECVCSPSLKAKELARLETLLDKHDRPLDSMIDMTDRGERLYPLDIICGAAEYGLDGNETKPQTLSKRQQFDYDQMLQEMNSAYDRLLTIARIKNTAERNAALEIFDKELRELSKATESKTRQALAVLTKKGRSQLFTDKLQGMMMPAIDAAMKVEQRDQFRRELWQLALALQKYRQLHQKFPEQLQRLVPQFIATIPQDFFAGKPLQYQAGANGLLLYSVGQDRVDHRFFAKLSESLHFPG